MTIWFYCPSCDALIAFDRKHCGKRARCLSCGQIFIIPYKNGETPEKVKLQAEDKGEPIPGFYKGVFIESWKLFADRNNVTTLAFVVAVVTFKFFMAGACCLNYLSHFVIWAWLLGFYLNIIYETAFGIDELPKIYIGTSVTFLWYILKPLFVFLATMVVVQIPFIIVLNILHSKGLSPENMWSSESPLRFILLSTFLFGLFLFPIAILTTAVGKDLTMLYRPDYLFKPVFKAFIPYLTTVILLTAAGLLELRTEQFDGQPAFAAAGDLMLNYLVQVLAIITMRSIGLFYRHYTCYLPW